MAYKTEVVKKLDIDFQRREELARRDQAFDKALLTCYLTKPKPELLISKNMIESVTLPEPDLNNGESRNSKIVIRNKRSYPIQPNHDGLSPIKKIKLTDPRTDSEDKSKCSRYLRGTCRRGRRCKYRH